MVVISAQQERGNDLRAVFSQLTAESCPHVYNFHMHTVCSDGKLQPEALIQQAIALKLKGFAITDHHTVRGYQAARVWLQSQQFSPAIAAALPSLWSGVEITARLLDTEVHILGYDFNPQHPVLQPYLQSAAVKGAAAQASQVIAALHQAGGLAVLAHPARYHQSVNELIPAAAELGIDGLETYYCYNNPETWRPSPEQTQQVQDLGIAHGLFHTCGTDTHGLNLLQRL